METKRVNVEDGVRWRRLIEWVRAGYLSRAVILTDTDGEPLAVIVDGEAGRLAAGIQSDTGDDELVGIREGVYGKAANENDASGGVERR